MHNAIDLLLSPGFIIALNEYIKALRKVNYIIKLSVNITQKYGRQKLHNLINIKKNLAYKCILLLLLNAEPKDQ
jgi:hypothetical protein